MPDEEKPVTCVCVWWLACNRPAVMERDHPVLGKLPICLRCNEKVDRLEED